MPASTPRRRRSPSSSWASTAAPSSQTGAATYGVAFDSAPDGGGGWFLEQWLAKEGEFYSDNENGRSAPSTRVLFDGPTGVELLTGAARTW